MFFYYYCLKYVLYEICVFFGVVLYVLHNVYSQLNVVFNCALKINCLGLPYNISPLSKHY